MFEKLTDYDLINISSYLNNLDSYSFILVSKRLKTLFYKEGFLKYISFGYNIINTDIYNFSITCSRHYKSLNSIYVSNTNNPQIWIQIIWPKIIHFNFCNITELIDPSYTTNTEELSIKQHEIANRNITLKINWFKFPRLKKLKIITFDIDLSGVDSCKNLKHIDIHLFNENNKFNNIKLNGAIEDILPLLSIIKNKY
jgi:glutaredoxin-related protein